MTAVVLAIDAAVAYPVFDGPPARNPSRSIVRYVTIGAAEDTDNQANPTVSAQMSATYTGLGQVAREERLELHCVATGKAKTIALARPIALAVVADVGAALPKSPTPETYGAQISSILAVRSHNISGGAIVQVQFIISATARLT